MALMLSELGERRRKWEMTPTRFDSTLPTVESALVRVSTYLSR